LEPGKVADILLVDGDPLMDLSALKRVRAVIHEGVLILQPPR
jgi:imidazolonepropionase-like amidohydrolase